MNQNQDNFKRGTAEMLILYLLINEDLYGYQITQAFAEKSKGGYTILEGSLYPILYRLEANGYISEYVKLVGKRRTRKYYHIENAGIDYFKQILSDYEKITHAIDMILDKEAKD